MWEDNTVDYFLGVNSLPLKTRPACSSHSRDPNIVTLFHCSSEFASVAFMSLCQLPLGSRRPHHYIHNNSSAITTQDKQPQIPSLSTHQQKQPSLARLKVKVKPVNSTATGQWWPVTCDGGHVTHVILACDTSTDEWWRHFLPPLRHLGHSYVLLCANGWPSPSPIVPVPVWGATCAVQSAV